MEKGGCDVIRILSPNNGRDLYKVLDQQSLGGGYGTGD
jgi:hypothetical protein